MKTMETHAHSIQIRMFDTFCINQLPIGDAVITKNEIKMRVDNNKNSQLNFTKEKNVRPLRTTQVVVGSCTRTVYAAHKSISTSQWIMFTCTPSESTTWDRVGTRIYNDNILMMNKDKNWIIYFDWRIFMKPAESFFLILFYINHIFVPIRITQTADTHTNTGTYPHIYKHSSFPSLPMDEREREREYILMYSVERRNEKMNG